MAAGGGFEFDREGNLPGGSFSRLLLSDDVVSDDDCKSRALSSSSSLFSHDTPKMLCFGDYCDFDALASSQITSQSVSSSSVSKSSSSASINSLPRSSNCNKKRNGASEKKQAISGDPSPKKSRPAAGINGSRSAAGHAKVKKREKLGERIAALQQLVSPYGKTDTASVLHETMGYIRFLQDQVKVLCSPYLHSLPSSSSPSTTCNGKNVGDSTRNLKNKGLCLVPVDGIADVASNSIIGADFWSPATMMSQTAASAAAAVSKR